jgi:hypothetical protein
MKRKKKEIVDLAKNTVVSCVAKDGVETWVMCEVGVTVIVWAVQKEFAKKFLPEVAQQLVEHGGEKYKSEVVL